MCAGTLTASPPLCKQPTIAQACTSVCTSPSRPCLLLQPRLHAPMLLQHIPLLYPP